MKKDVIYLIPTSKSDTGKVYEYKMIIRKPDYRFRFCKQNKQYIISEELFNMFKSQEIVHRKDNRFIIQGAKNRYEIGKFLQNYGYTA